jgi:hypothetical protein
MMDVAFQFSDLNEDPTKSKPEVMLDALQKRVDYLRANPSELADAFGHCDTYME